MKAASWNTAYHAALLAGLLAGCAGGQEAARESGPVNLSGFSSSFKQGYAAGCESAGMRSQRRDEGRYRTESDYMRGWNDGFSVCRKSR